MKKWMKIISLMLVVAFFIPVSITVLAANIASSNEITLAGINGNSVTQAVNCYFEERVDYLLDETTIMDWSVSGVVNDEIAHKTQYAEKGITLLDVSYTVESVVCFDTYAEASAVETVYYSKNGSAYEEDVVHTLTLYLGSTNTCGSCRCL